MNTRSIIAACIFAASLGSVAGAQTFFFVGGGFIPDGGTQAGTFGPPRLMTATSNATQPIQDVVLAITMNHTFVGDLRIRLSYTPTGSSTTYTATVAERVGAASAGAFGSTNNINGTFSFAAGGTSFNAAATAFENLNFGIFAPFKNNFNGTYPVVEFADFFRGLPGTGTWTLTFQDGAMNDIGSVSNASIALQASTPACLADFNTDGVVNTADLTYFLGRFGQACP